MLRSLFVLAVGSTLVACAPQDKAPVAVQQSALASASEQTVSLHYGETSAPITVRARHSGVVQFAGNKGDAVEAWVRSPLGDAVAALVDSNDRVLVSNDDASCDTSDARLKVTLPADGSYRIQFGEYAGQRASFTVELQGSGVFSCNVDSDCVAVAKAGCCHNGWLEAVSAGAVEHYDALYACVDAAPVCANYIVQDTRVAVCDRVAHHCGMIAPTDIVCGGLAAQHVCPDGFVCQAEGPGADRLGKCVAAQ